MSSVMHGPFDPEVLKSWVIILLWFAALCILVVGPIALFILHSWRGSREKPNLIERKEETPPDDRAI
jgi:hypothetical protein